MHMVFRKLAIIGSTNHGTNHKLGIGNIWRQERGQSLQESLWLGIYDMLVLRELR